MYDSADPSLYPPGRPPGSPAAGERRRSARETSPGTEGTHISQDLVGGSLAIDTLPANETRIVVSLDPPRAGPSQCLTTKSYFQAGQGAGGAAGSGLTCEAGSRQPGA